MVAILVTGAVGQIGSELVIALRERYGRNAVIASDIRELPEDKLDFYPYEKLDVLDKAAIAHLVEKYQITTIHHLAAILSATGEQNPQLCFQVNVIGLYNILEIARLYGVKQIVCPSSIAVFGPETPAIHTPQETIILPKTMYGVSKAAGELMSDYYVEKYGIDVRGLRYPGLISHKALPGGGTTDYAVEIFYEAILHGRYTCFLSPDTTLPMMYMPDAIRGTIALAEADFSALKHHANFNFSSMSFSCRELVSEIQRHIPHFEVTYKPDYRQQIADSWPKSIDDSVARQEWGWKPEYDLASMTADMIHHLREKL